MRADECILVADEQEEGERIGMDPARGSMNSGEPRDLASSFRLRQRVALAGKGVHPVGGADKIPADTQGRGNNEWHRSR